MYSVYSVLEQLKALIVCFKYTQDALPYSLKTLKRKLKTQDVEHFSGIAKALKNLCLSTLKWILMQR